MEGPTADLVGKRSLMSVSLPSSSILLIQPSPALCAILDQYFSVAIVDICLSYETAMISLPLHAYQIVICPQRLAARDQYSLLRLNQVHNPCSPFIVTTEQGEVADVRQAIDHGALGFLHGTTSTPNIILNIHSLMELYRSRFSLARRWKWVTDYRDQLQRNLIQDNSEVLRSEIYDNRVMREQALVAIEGSILVYRTQADNRVSEARKRMWDI